MRAVESFVDGAVLRSREESLVPNLGAPEIILILAIVLIVFGAGKLPDVMSQLGRGVREFRDSASGKDDEKTTPKSTTETKS